MVKRKQLSKRQLAVIEDMFSGELDEQAVLDKYKVSRNVYNKWRADEQFAAEFDRRTAALNRQSELIIARYASLAAAKLVQLTESEKEETARRACLDIITLPSLTAKRIEQSSETRTADAPQVQPLSEATVSRLLAALAEEKEE